MDSLKPNFALKVSFAENNDVFSEYGAVTVAPAGSTAGTSKKVASFSAVAFGNVDNNTLTGDTNVVSASAVTAGSVSVTLSLIAKKDNSGTTTYEDVAGSAYTFNISAVGLNEVKNAMIEDLDLQQASTSTSAKTVTPKVSAMVDGKKVTLVVTKDYEVISGTEKVPMDSTLEKPDSIGKAKVSVILKGSGQVITKEYEYSKANPVLTTAKLKDGAEINGAALVDNAAVKDLFELEDQYGNDFTSSVQPTDLFITFSNLPENVKATNNGFTSASIAANALKKDDVITIKVVFGKSKVVFEGDVKVK